MKLLHFARRSASLIAAISMAITVAVVPTARAEELQPRLTIETNGGATRILGITPDGKAFFTANDAGPKRWDLASGKELPLPKLPGRPCALSKDATLLALSDEQVVRVWDIAKEKEIAALRHEHAVRVAAFSPDGKRIATGWTKDGFKPGSRVGVATVWDIAAGTQGAPLETGPGGLGSLAFSPDGKLLAGATSDFPLIGDVTVWDLATGKVHSILLANGVNCIAFSPNGKTLAAGCTAHYREGRKEGVHARVWDVAGGKDLHHLRHENTIHCVAFTADSRTLAVGTYYGEVKLWDAASAKEIASLPRQPSYVLSLALSEDGRTLVSSRRDGVITCWDVRELIKR